MDWILNWLGRRPHRATVVNALMLSVILAMIGSADLYALIGSLALVVASVNFLVRAAQQTFALRSSSDFYQLALIWVPGLLAVLLGAVSLYLVTSNPAAGLAYTLGAILFAMQIAMLAVTAADLSDAKGNIARVEFA